MSGKDSTKDNARSVSFAEFHYNCTIFYPRYGNKHLRRYIAIHFQTKAAQPLSTKLTV